MCAESGAPPSRNDDQAWNLRKQRRANLNESAICEDVNAPLATR